MTIQDYCTHHLNFHCRFFVINIGQLVVGGRTLARQTDHNCIKCFRTNPEGIPTNGKLAKFQTYKKLSIFNSWCRLYGSLYIKKSRERQQGIQMLHLCIWLFYNKGNPLRTSFRSQNTVVYCKVETILSLRCNVWVYLLGSNFIGTDKKIEILYIFLEKNEDNI